MAAKRITLRKQIGDAVYDLMVKSTSDQVIDEVRNKNLTSIINEIYTELGTVATSEELEGINTVLTTLMLDANPDYDTLKKIGEWISAHQTIVLDEATLLDIKDYLTANFESSRYEEIDADSGYLYIS